MVSPNLARFSAAACWSCARFRALRACRLAALGIALLPVLLWTEHPHLALLLSNTSVLICAPLLLFTLATGIPKRVRQAIPLPVFMAYLLVYYPKSICP